jgi:hypothetical protein
MEKKTDFIDTDLVLRREGKPVEPYRRLPQADLNDQSEVPMQSISELSLGRMAKHKAEVKSGLVNAIGEIESLRQRQDELEQEKRDLEELGQKQVEYERGKREVIDHLNQGIVALEKKEIQSAQLTELLVATRNRFKDALNEIEHINEQNWAEVEFRKELYKALVIIDDARVEYNKALAKIQALEGSRESILDSGSISKMSSANEVGERSFGTWVKIGFAVSVPFWLLAILATVAYLVLHFGLRS